MKRILKYFVVWFLVILMILQTSYIPKASAAQSAQSGDTITILFTHDMHDNFLPFRSEQGGFVSNLGGYARLTTAINVEREKDRNALLFDAGDYSMGTPFQTIYGSDSPELRIMGQMGYDAVTFGNHEFDYRPAGLAESLNTAKNSGDRLPEIVQSNMVFPKAKDGSMTQTLTDLKNAMNTYGVKDYTILERGGLKIGVFGLMGKDSASKAPMSEVEFSDEVEQAKRVVKILKEQEKVDLIVCLSHSGTWAKKSDSEDEILAKKVPEINVILSGHTHTVLQQPVVSGNTIIGSVGDYGRNLGVIKVARQPDGGWQLADYRLVKIDDSITGNEEIAAKVAEFKGIVQQKYFDKFNIKYDDIIASSPFNFQTIDDMSINHKESYLGNIISDSYLYAVKQAEGESYNQDPVAAAIVPCGTIRASIFKGFVTAADAFSISSLGIGADKLPGYPLISVYLTGKELKTVAEVDASIAPIMSDAQLFISGMNITFNPHRLIFNKVTSTALVVNPANTLADPSVTTEPIEDTKLYRVVAGLYSAQMLSVVGDKSFGLLSIVPKTKEGKPITDFEAQIIYQTENGSKRELKEWYALNEYLQSFEKEDGIPQIPEYYNKSHGRKVVEDSKSFIAIIKNPNKIALTVYILIPAILILIIAIILRIILRRRFRKLQKSADGKNNKSK